MLKNEFLAILNKNSANTWVSEEDYCTIEHVYSYHPAIKDKEHIVQLYLDFGMTVIKDMLKRADQCAIVENRINSLEHELEAARNELLNLKE